MADIYARVKLLEKKLNFVMNSIRMKGAVGSGLLKADGTPDMRLVEGSLAEFYELAKRADEVISEDPPDSLDSPSIIDTTAEVVNG